MKESYIEFSEFWKDLTRYAKKIEFDNEEVLKWLVVKTLRLHRKQFDNIRQIESGKADDVKMFLLEYIAGRSLSEIFGYIEFYGNFFDVTENVFDPRLSTESLVTSILELDKIYLKNANILDVCTGSGCVAITLAKKTGAQVDAIDISPLALEIANKNAKKIGGSVRFMEFDITHDWESFFDKNYDIIVSNPPYWDESKILNNVETVKGNPLIGFDGGKDGLKFIQIIIKNGYKKLNKNGFMFLEMDPDQEERIAKIMTETGFSNIKTAKDYRQINRVIYGQKL